MFKRKVYAALAEWKEYLFSQKDVGHMEQLIYKPIYMLPFVIDELFTEIAKEAKAILHIRKIALVDMDRIDKYLELFYDEE